MYKAIAFFDLDHTLLNEQTKVDDEVVDAMKQLRENNVLPVISSGRNIFEITEILNRTGIDTVVGANGSYVEYEGKPVYKSLISNELIEEFMEFAKPFDDSVTVYNDEDYRINFVNDNVKSNYASINTPIPPLGVNDYIKNHEIVMMVINTVGHDKDYIDKFAGKLTFYRNTPYSMDVVMDGGSKKRGIQELQKNAGLENIPTYAFGDGNNDVPMLEYVDHPVVMGNGLPHVKELAEFITTNNTNHGIVNGLKHFDLI
ncbi:Cof-type HAD-IIB family hydrolase [Lentilactobacillus sp. SPB1-3]|uniref:Cof-type HAD-IIB family hydrolase n=1 Tax=Lentilactobacillus terminaliae TaxID=3003483 RepID=A0ACD5DD47_9LACO|nr:Cof-type HAD-IIB family hydrolase [Lentilactobacillus sp. SPB1-3]MCZ0977440.1 Cof-type HAD-IIB family hydrolase [Lentilactobacillus sp. SPB1-3]